MIRKILAATAILALIPLPAQAEDLPQAAEAKTIAQGKSYLLASTIMDEDREINIWLPPGYDENSDNRYNVLYLIDGGTEQDFPHIAGLAQHGTISWNFEPLIVVGIKTNTRVYELTQPATDERYGEYQNPNGGADRFRRFIGEEVKPWVEANYRTNGNDAVIGESLAGLFIVDTLLKSPDMFGDYIAVSPSLWWNREELAADAADLLANGEPAQRDTRLYVTMANEGGTMQRGLDTFLSALRAHKPDSMTVHYADRRNAEEHASIYHIAALDALRRLYGMPHRTGSPSAAPWLLTSDAPELSDYAKDNVEQECTRETAIRVGFAEVNENRDYWRGVCILPDGFRMDPATLGE